MHYKSPYRALSNWIEALPENYCHDLSKSIPGASDNGDMTCTSDREQLQAWLLTYWNTPAVQEVAIVTFRACVDYRYSPLADPQTWIHRKASYEAGLKQAKRRILACLEGHETARAHDKLEEYTKALHDLPEEERIFKQLWVDWSALKDRWLSDECLAAWKSLVPFEFTLRLLTRRSKFSDLESWLDRHPEADPWKQST